MTLHLGRACSRLPMKLEPMNPAPPVTMYLCVALTSPHRNNQGRLALAPPSNPRRHVEETVDGPRIPPETLQHAMRQLVSYSIVVVYVGDLELTAGRRRQRVDHAKDGGSVEVDSDYSIV